VKACSIELSKPIRFFDAHCDAVIKILDHGVDFFVGSGEAHVSYPALRAGNIAVQVFACFVLSAQYPGAERPRAEEMIEALVRLAGVSDGGMTVVKTAADLPAAGDDGIGAILALEGADPLEGRAENLRGFYDLGIRSVIFAWQDNAFSGTAFGADTPLSAAGERLLGLCEELGVMVDVSHLSDSAFDDVRNQATRPFIASHSNCRALCPSLRNLTDPMIRTLADSGGVMGINLAPAFLSPEACSAWAAIRSRMNNVEGVADPFDPRIGALAASVPRPAIDWVAKHVRHAIDIGGENCVGIGGDLDGILQTPVGIETIADYPAIVPVLERAGLSQRQIDKVTCENFLRVFSEVLPAGERSTRCPAC